MAKNLKRFKFTNKADKAISKTDWVIDIFAKIDTGAGNDTITGTGSDTGIISFSKIDTGAGNDIITGTGTSRGIDNYSTIDTGAGNDIITGTGKDFGIFSYGNIITGAGNDIITGTGSDTGINGTIATGDGNDTITGIGKDCGIAAAGIDTGAGDDIVDALKGGFEDGVIYLGSGNDTLKGFGDSVNVWGGVGTDKILFGEGTYIVSEYRIDSDTETMYRSMYFNEFEQIGGANGGLFTFGNGTLTVDSAGIATFA